MAVAQLLQCLLSVHEASCSVFSIAQTRCGNALWSSRHSGVGVRGVHCQGVGVQPRFPETLSQSKTKLMGWKDDLVGKIEY